MLAPPAPQYNGGIPHISRDWDQRPIAAHGNWGHNQSYNPFIYTSSRRCSELRKTFSLNDVTLFQNANTTTPAAEQPPDSLSSWPEVFHTNDPNALFTAAWARHNKDPFESLKADWDTSMKRWAAIRCWKHREPMKEYFGTSAYYYTLKDGRVLKLPSLPRIESPGTTHQPALRRWSFDGGYRQQGPAPHLLRRQEPSASEKKRKGLNYWTRWVLIGIFGFPFFVILIPYELYFYLRKYVKFRKSRVRDSTRQRYLSSRRRRSVPFSESDSEETSSPSSNHLDPPPSRIKQFLTRMGKSHFASILWNLIKALGIVAGATIVLLAFAPSNWVRVVHNVRRKKHGRGARDRSRSRSRSQARNQVHDLPLFTPHPQTPKPEPPSLKIRLRTLRTELLSLKDQFWVAVRPYKKYNVQKKKYGRDARDRSRSR